jgi:SNF2 family DNA or RNA helicase
MSTSRDWINDGSRIRLRTASGSLLDVSAADIVGVEFKGRTMIQGRNVSSKPSESIREVEFRRFPLEPWLVLRAPASGGSASCDIILRDAEKDISIDSIPRDRDQVIVDNVWYAVATSLLLQIDGLLASCGAAPGPIKLRQFLQLAALDFERVLFEKPSQSSVVESLVGPAASAPFEGVLYPYQITGVRWIRFLANEGLGGILGDEMGLGKTVQVIAALSEEAGSRPNLIVAPATILENWRREFVRFAPDLKVAVHRGAGRTGFPSSLRDHDVVITSYDTVVRDLAMLKMLAWRFVILDEAQAIKNADTLRARSLRQIPKRTGLAVTGTPLENRLEDLWSILDFSCPGVLGPLNDFRKRFENTIDGAAALQPVVSPLLLRRRIVEVAADLPERIDIPVAIEMPIAEATRYEQIRQAILHDYGATATLVALTKLRAFCAHPFVLEPIEDDPAAYSAKYVRLMEILDEVVAARDKIIVFTSFKRMIDLLVRDIDGRFGIPCFWIDGRTPVEDRQDIVDRFSEVGSSAALILNPRAAGTGLNIVAANHVLHYNLEWNPAVEDQASARAHRRGQRRPVTVHRLYYIATVEEIVDQRVVLKRQLAAAAVVGTAGKDDISDLAEALRVSPVRNTTND